MLVSLNAELNSALARVWFELKFLERRSAIPLLLFFGASVFKSYTLLLSETEFDTKQEQVQTPKQKKSFDTKEEMRSCNKGGDSSELTQWPKI